MKWHVLLRTGWLALGLGLAACPAWSDDDCDAPPGRWQTRDAVRQMASAQGWQIQRLKIDDGCYEIRGTDARGRLFKATLDPETLKVLKMKTDAHRHERDRPHEGAPERHRAAPPGGASAPSTGPPRGTAPQGQIE